MTGTLERDHVGHHQMGSAGRKGSQARPASSRVLLLVWSATAFVLVLLPTVLLFRLSSRQSEGGAGFANYVEFATDPALRDAAWNSLWTALLTTVGTLVLGVPIAFLVSRTDLPLQRMLRLAPVAVFAVPSLISTLGWILLLGPRSGMLNTPLQSLFNLDEGPFNVMSPLGIVFVLVSLLYPLILLPTAAAFDNMDLALEQAASSLGASRATVLRRVTLPVVMPGIVAGIILVFTASFIAFAPVALLGGPEGFENISTAMLRLLNFPPRLEMAAVLGVPTLLILGGLLLIQRRMFGDRGFAIVSGKPAARTTLQLGRWRWPVFVATFAVFVVTVVLPIGVLVVTSVRDTLGNPMSTSNITFTDNYQRVFEQPRVLEAMTNSLVLAGLAALAGIAVGLMGAWLVERTPSRATGVVAPTMLAPLAFPGAILGISLVITYARQPFGLGGSLTILFIAYVIGNLPLTFIYLSAALKQVDRSMEEAARSLGASWVTTMRRVTLPLLQGPILVVGLLTFILQFRDLESSIFLFNGTNVVIAVVLFNLAQESLFQLLSALSVVILVANVVVIAAMGAITRFWRRRGRSVAETT